MWICFSNTLVKKLLASKRQHERPSSTSTHKTILLFDSRFVGNYMKKLIFLYTLTDYRLHMPNESNPSWEFQDGWHGDFIRKVVTPFFNRVIFPQGPSPCVIQYDRCKRSPVIEWKPYSSGFNGRHIGIVAKQNFDRVLLLHGPNPTYEFQIDL